MNYIGKKMKKNTFACLAVLLSSLTATTVQAGHAGYIMDDVEITRIYPTSNGSDAVWVYFNSTASTDRAHCSGVGSYSQNKVKLVKSASDSTIKLTSGAFTRSFSLATSALLEGKRVHIYAYNESSTSKDMCTNGVVGGIELTSSDVN